jgi:hypothetical protein
MVSGFITSPEDLSKISSGEANEIVIDLKSLVGFATFFA